MGVSFSSGRTPFYRKMMVFVDGTNFLCNLAKELEVSFSPGEPPPSALDIASSLIKNIYKRPGVFTIRRYWFSSYKEDLKDEDIFGLEVKLRCYGFEPKLFMKKGGREKGVDIALAKEMLINAFNQNYDIGLLIAGDGDYVGLVNDVKRYGQLIVGAFFRRHGLSKELHVAFDEYYDIIKTSGYVIGKNYEKSLKELRKFCNKAKTKSKK